MFTAEEDLTLAHALADVADAIATRYFRQRRLEAQTKADGSPVTEADRLVEAALREQLLRHRPGDSFVGEESGAHGCGGRRWFVDPIDGTAGFVAGRPDWRTLIAVEDAGIIAMGLVSSPGLHRRWWAMRAGGAWTRRYVVKLNSPDTPHAEGVSHAPDEPTPLQVTGTTRLERAKIAVWPVGANLPCSLLVPTARLAALGAQSRQQKHTERQRSPDSSTATGTRHGALLVASGEIDGFLLAGGRPWDLAALVPIVEEAGGQFSDMSGGRSLDAPAALFSNGMLHVQILRCLQEAPRVDSGLADSKGGNGG
ncbi:MAG: inositol monophosphatase family protein [Egibacteraceae bacterium]